MADEKVIIEIVLDDGSVQRGFAKINKQSKKTGEKISSNIGGSLRSAAVSGLAFVGAFVGLRSIINNLRNFEKAFAEINTITELTIKQQKALSDQLIETSAQFGTTAQEQAKSFYQIISAGVTDAAKANELLIASNKLAIGGLASTASSIDILTSAVNAFGQENLSATRASDILFTTVRLGKTTISELSSSLGQILPSASALGVSFEDTNAALAALTTRGISTSEAITQLNAVFTAVLKKQDAAKKLGPEVAKAFNLQALQAKGLSKFLKDLNASLGGSEEKLVKLLGRAEGARAIITLAGDSFQSLDRNVRALSGSESLGAADKAFEKVAQTVDQKLNVASSRLSAIFLKLSTTTTGPLADSLDFLNQELKEVFDTFKLFDNFGDFFESSLFAAEIALIDFVISAKDILGQIPIIGPAIAAAFANGFQETLEARKEELTIAIADNIISDDALLAVDENMEKVKEVVKIKLKSIKTVAKKEGKEFNKAFGAGIASGVQQFTKALANGEDAFSAFAKASLSVIGDLAIQLGQFFIIEGIAVDALKSVSGSGAIAAGLALVALGTLLKGAGGSAESAAGGGVVAPGAPASVQDDSISEDDELDGPSQSVVVNVEGTVIDPKTTGQQIADVLEEYFDSSGDRIVSVG